MARSHILFTWFIAGPLTVAPSQGPTFVALGDLRPVLCVAYSSTAPTGSNVTVDVKADGVSLFTSPLTVGQGTNRGKSVAFTSPPRVVAGAILTLDLTSVGSLEGGRDLTVQLDLEEI